MLLTRLCCTICRIVSVVSLRLALIGSKTTHAAARLGALVSEVSRLAQLVNKLAAISADSLTGIQCIIGGLLVGLSLLGLRVPSALIECDSRIYQRLQQHAQQGQDDGHPILRPAATRPHIATPAAPTPTTLMIQSTTAV